MMVDDKSMCFVYAITGADRFLRQAALERLLAKLGSALDEMGPTRVDGSTAELADVLDEVRTASLLGDSRVVIVDDADEFVSKHRERLERYCAQPSSTGVLILLCNSMPANTRLYKIIKKSGDVIKVETPAKRAMTDWVIQHAERAYDKRIAWRVAEALRHSTGDLPGLLDAELSKLATYVGARDTIESSDLDAVTGRHREEKVFAVIDHVLSGHTAGALEMWEQVLATNRAASAPAVAVGGLAAALRRWLQARRMMDAGRSLGEVAKTVWIPEAERHLARVSTGELEALQRDLLTAELSSRSGTTDVPCAIEKWIVTHSAGQVANATR